MLIHFILFLIAFAGTFYVMPHSILKLREAGYVAKDMYKSDLTLVPTNAGMIVLFISYISIALLPLIVRLLNLFIPIEGEISDLSQINLAFLLVVSIYAFYGLIDDLVDIGRKLKLVFPIIFGYPLISLINPSFIWIPFYGDYNLDYVIFETITSGDIFRIIIIPIYIMVVANLVNMHSGYNGLQSGLSIIVISTLLFKSWLDGLELESLPAWAFLGSIMAFWFKNFYPAKVFEGNIGSLLFGSVIGCLIVIQEYWWFGFFILIPHTFNFVLWMIWLILMKINPEKYIEVDGEHKKFGEVGKDGSLIVPNTLTLKWIPNYYLNITERTSTLIMYSLTTIFCLTSIIIF